MFLLSTGPINRPNNINDKAGNDKTKEAVNPDSLLYKSINNVSNVRASGNVSPAQQACSQSLQALFGKLKDAIIDSGYMGNWGQVKDTLSEFKNALASEFGGSPDDIIAGNLTRGDLLEKLIHRAAYPPRPTEYFNRPPDIEALNNLNLEDVRKFWLEPHAFGGGPICCSPNTKIKTQNGERKIADIKVGDIVLTDGKKPVRVKEVSKVKVKNHKILKITLNDRTVLEISPGHPTSDGRKLSDLKEGDILDGRKVIETKLISYTDDYTYDILPDSESGNYYANSVLIGSTLSAVIYSPQSKRASSHQAVLS